MVAMVMNQSVRGVTGYTSEELLPEAVKFDGLDDAHIGLGAQYTNGHLLIYSARKILSILMKRDGMDYEEACEFFEFNIACLWAGKGTPIIVYDLMGDV